MRPTRRARHRVARGRGMAKHDRSGLMLRSRAQSVPPEFNRSAPAAALLLHWVLWGRVSLQLSSSVQRHPTARGPSLTGPGNSLAAIIR
jgi:hypothetical protein